MKSTEKAERDEDREIVSRCQQGDVDAFEVLVQKYQKKMMTVAYRLIGNYEEAGDTVQDAFVSAYKALKGFRGDAKFSTWLTTIVMNHARNRLLKLRTEMRREAYSLNDPLEMEDGELWIEPASNNPSALEQLETKDIQKNVQDCINGLDDEFREVMVLRDIQGFAYEEISEILNIVQGTVKSRLSRARNTVKDCLKKVMGE